jgi:hypothetical protein
MLGDGIAFWDRAPREQNAQPLRKLPDIVFVTFGASQGCPLTRAFARWSIRQTFTLGLLQRRFLDKDSLPLIAPARPAETHHDSTKRRIFAGAPRERRVSPGQVRKVIKIGTGEAERLLVFDS